MCARHLHPGGPPGTSVTGEIFTALRARRTSRGAMESPGRCDGAEPDASPPRRAQLMGLARALGGGRRALGLINLVGRQQSGVAGRRDTYPFPANANTASPGHCHPSDEPAAGPPDRLGVDTGTQPPRCRCYSCWTCRHRRVRAQRRADRRARSPVGRTFEHPNSSPSWERRPGRAQPKSMGAPTPSR